MVQVLVEFQYKAVNMQQIVTIIGTIHGTWVLHAITSRIAKIVRVGKRMRNQTCFQGQTQQFQTFCRQQLPSYYMWRPWGHQPQSSKPLGQGEVLEGADNQNSGAQGRPVRDSMYQGHRQQFCRGLLTRDNIEKTAIKKLRKIKDIRPTVSSHLNTGTSTTSITDMSVKETPNNKVAKR